MKNGSILILGLLIVSLLLMLGGVFLSLSLINIKTIEIGADSERAYWIALAGINQTIHDLQFSYYNHDQNYREIQFEDSICRVATLPLSQRGIHVIIITSIGSHKDVKASLSSEVRIDTPSDYVLFFDGSKDFTIVQSPSYLIFGPVHLNGNLSMYGYLWSMWDTYIAMIKSPEIAGPSLSLSGYINYRGIVNGNPVDSQMTEKETVRFTVGEGNVITRTNDPFLRFFQTIDDCQWIPGRYYDFGTAEYYDGKIYKISNNYPMNITNGPTPDITGNGIFQDGLHGGYSIPIPKNEDITYTNYANYIDKNWYIENENFSNIATTELTFVNDLLIKKIKIGNGKWDGINPANPNKLTNPDLYKFDMPKPYKTKRVYIMPNNEAVTYTDGGVVGLGWKDLDQPLAWPDATAPYKTKNTAFPGILGSTIPNIAINGNILEIDIGEESGRKLYLTWKIDIWGSSPSYWPTDPTYFNIGWVDRGRRRDFQNYIDFYCNFNYDNSYHKITQYENVDYIRTSSKITIKSFIDTSADGSKVEFYYANPTTIPNIYKCPILTVNGATKTAGVDYTDYGTGYIPKVVFTTTPPSAGATIEFNRQYNMLANINQDYANSVTGTCDYIVYHLLPPKTTDAILIDQNITAVMVNLNKIDKNNCPKSSYYPSGFADYNRNGIQDSNEPDKYGIIYSKVPLVVYGSPKVPLTIICEEDVYLRSINKEYIQDDDSKANPVGIISKKVVFIDHTADNTEGRNVILNKVAVFTSANELYSFGGMGGQASDWPNVEKELWFNKVRIIGSIIYGITDLKGEENCYKSYYNYDVSYQDREKIRDNHKNYIDSWMHIYYVIGTATITYNSNSYKFGTRPVIYANSFRNNPPPHMPIYDKRLLMKGVTVPNAENFINKFQQYANTDIQIPMEVYQDLLTELEK